MKRTLLFCFAMISQMLVAQISLKGKVLDLYSQKGLPYATIKETEHGETCQTDSTGHFNLILQDSGIHTFTILHEGCKKNVISLLIHKDTALNFYLDHREKEVAAVSIKAKKQIIPQEIVVANRAGQDITTAMQSLQGLSILQTGNNINKPMINGIHSQRLILNYDNMRFESQQWGNEHAPEIDANALYKIRLIQGSEALQYGSEAFSGILKFEPDYSIETNKKLSGQFKSGFALNGMKYFGSLALKGQIKSFQYYIQSSAGKQGNVRAPDYFLNNTGLEETTLNSGVLWNTKMTKIKLFYSRFYNNIGILAASHIGNLQDLQNAIQSGNPAGQDSFYYDINNPSQKVFHEIIKGSVDYKIKQNTLSVQVSNQYNLRNEYDFVLQVANKNKPVAFLKLNTFQVQSNYFINRNNTKWNLGAGWSWMRNNYGGTFFIPAYEAHHFHGFVYQESKLSESFVFKGTMRYDREDRNVYQPNTDSVKVQNKFDGISLGAELKYIPHQESEHSFFVSYCWRPPHVAELYSNGLHHGTGTYETGNDGLKKEISIGFSEQSIWYLNKLTLQINPYYYYFPEYILLTPTLQYVQTIRGYFPTWSYKPIQAHYYGFNAGVAYQINKFLQTEAKYQFIRIHETGKSNVIPLTPQQIFSTSLRFKKNIQKKNNLIESSLSCRYYVKRTDADTAMDYAPPPPGYALVDLNFLYHFKEIKLPLTIEFSIQNLLNLRYRNYTDRLRYFADSKGIDCSIKLYLNF